MYHLRRTCTAIAVCRQGFRSSAHSHPQACREVTTSATPSSNEACRHMIHSLPPGADTAPSLPRNTDRPLFLFGCRETGPPTPLCVQLRPRASLMEDSTSSLARHTAGWLRCQQHGAIEQRRRQTATTLLWRSPSGQMGFASGTHVQISGDITPSPILRAEEEDGRLCRPWKPWSV